MSDSSIGFFKCSPIPRTSIKTILTCKNYMNSAKLPLDSLLTIENKTKQKGPACCTCFNRTSCDLFVFVKKYVFSVSIYFRPLHSLCPRYLANMVLCQENENTYQRNHLVRQALSFLKLASRTAFDRGFGNIPCTYGKKLLCCI